MAENVSDKKRGSGRYFVSTGLAGIFRISVKICRYLYCWSGAKKRKYAKLQTVNGDMRTQLYKCPACQIESQINSSGDSIWCGACGKYWILGHHGRVRARKGKSEFCSTAEWQNWERESVREEIRKGTYRFEDTVRVETMADTGAFVRQGSGSLIQTPDGTRLECRYYGEDYTLLRSARVLERIEIQHNPQGTGDCIDLPASGGCFRCYLSKRNAVTKLAYATEEIHRQALQQVS